VQLEAPHKAGGTGTPKPYTPSAWSSACPRPHSSTGLSQEQADLAEPAACTPKPAYKESTWQAEGTLFSSTSKKRPLGPDPDGCGHMAGATAAP